MTEKIKLNQLYNRLKSFEEDIQDFNKIYKLPVNTTPTLSIGVPVLDRLKDFKNILLEEIDELDDIIEKIELGEVDDFEILTDLGDFLGDVHVYCASEMMKFGLPIGLILAAIMESNFSKLDENGKPIYDERGKVLKGPNYWKPEPLIRQILEAKFNNNETLNFTNLLDGYAKFVDEVWITNSVDEVNKEEIVSVITKSTEIPDNYKEYLTKIIVQKDIRDLFIMSNGLTEEAGEVVGIIKKQIRDNGSQFINEKTSLNKLKKELGDVFYYLVKICNQYKIKPSEIIKINRDKIYGRIERGTLHGSGDDR